MKVRNGFVSNSSSASFILQVSKMSDLQIYAMFNLDAMTRALNIDFRDDGWTIKDAGEFIHGDTIMDNGAMTKFFKAIGLSEAAIVNYDGDC